METKDPCVVVEEHIDRLAQFLAEHQENLGKRRWWHFGGWLGRPHWIFSACILGVELAFCEHLALPYATDEQEERLLPLIAAAKKLLKKK